MAKLVINPTSASKKEIPIVARVISIGRDPSNDLVLQDSMVSRRHAILEQRDDVYVLRDNGSSNGTLVNGDRLDVEKTLSDGDLVAIGSSRLLFRLDDGGDSSGLELPARSASPGSDGFALPNAERHCPACGRVALPADRFCRGCGAGLEEGAAKVVCSSCGADVMLPADFCGSCGKSIRDAGKAQDLATQPHRRDDLMPAFAKASAGQAPAAKASAGQAPAAKASAGQGLASPMARPRPGRPVSENAGFGLRLVAAVIDLMILGIPFLLIVLLWASLSMGSPASSARGLEGSVPLAVGGLAWLLVSFFYFFAFWAFRGATPGASLLSLEVRTEGGETPVGPLRATMRAFAAFVTLLPLGLGFLSIALSDERLALYDRISGTRVTRAP